MRAITASHLFNTSGIHAATDNPQRISTAMDGGGVDGLNIASFTMKGFTTVTHLPAASDEYYWKMIVSGKMIDGRAESDVQIERLAFPSWTALIEAV